MKGRTWICALLALVLLAGVLPLNAAAIDLIETDEPVSLTIHCVDGTTNLEGAAFTIYQVATTDAFCNLTPTAAFADLLKDVELDMEDADWRQLALTLEGQVTGIEPTCGPKTTGADGKVTFGVDEEIPQGLYLVVGNTYQFGEYRYQQLPFLVMLPGHPVKSDGTVDIDKWDYSVLLKNDKHLKSDITNIKVIKKWIIDNNYREKLPEYITVWLVCDGVKVQPPVKLSAENGWQYEWRDLEPDHRYTVVEEPVDGFKDPVIDTTSTRKIGYICFTITNEYIVPPPSTELPQTGQLWWPVPVLMSLGLLFVLVGLIRRRGDSREA